MPDFTVKRRGTDSSGRGVYASQYMWDWWLEVCDELGFTPTIVQGAWMTLAGGGAGASAGYHDGGGCFDLRTWDLKTDQVEQVIRCTRRRAAASYVRDHRHGMDPHIHLCLGSDADIDDGAYAQWREYLAGGDGLVGGGRDYHWRPDPIVTKPPEDDMKDADFDKIRKIVREELAAELDRAVDVDGKRRSLRQLVKEVWQKRGA